MLNFAKLFGLNHEQAEAIDIHKNVSLSAGAGSGKTRVLTSRFLTLLEDGIAMDNIVAITFTEKAALEMRERIRKGIMEKISAENQGNRHFWQQQLDHLNRANISTIHSFCRNIVQENAAVLGLDIAFDIIDSLDKTLFLKEKARGILEDYIKDSHYADVVDYFSTNFKGGYLNNQFLTDLLNCREAILEGGYSIEAVETNCKGNNITSFIISIISKVDKAYRDYKLDNNRLDFTDLQCLALQLLQDEDVLNNYKNRYTRFLVDEFQDTNEIQKSIIYRFASDEEEKLIPKTLFIVGDLKQSIYGFRGTDSRIFRKVTMDMGTEGSKALQTCYRSEVEIVEAINETFQKLINDYEPLKPKEDATPSEKRTKIVTYKKEKVQLENKIKVDAVKQLIKDKEADKEKFIQALWDIKDTFGKGRKTAAKDNKKIVQAINLLIKGGLAYKDICILIRSRYGLQQIEEELSQYKIPYCVIGGLGFFEKSEIKEVLNLYELVVKGFEEKLPEKQIIKLIGILRGPLFQISDDIILKIRSWEIENSCINFLEAMEQVIGEIKEKEETERLIYALRTIRDLADTAKKLSAVRVLESIITKCSMKEIYLTMKNGIQRVRNLEKLVFIAQEYDRKIIFSSTSFIDYIQLLMDEKSNEAEAALDTEDSDAVKIMTIHASKGLEFEGVLIPEIHKDRLWKTEDELKNRCFLFKEGEITLRLNDDGEENDSYQQLKEEYIERAIEEEIRVLYVAMTRAKKYIVLVGTEEESDETTDIKGCKSYLKMLNYAIGENADTDTIQWIDGDSLEEAEIIDGLLSIGSNNAIDQEKIAKALSYHSNIQPMNYVSASKYMRYKICPRKYYYDHIVKLEDKDYEYLIYGEEKEEAATIEFVEAAEETNSAVIIKKKTLKASQKGTLVHTYIENVEKHGKAAAEEILGENLKTHGFEDEIDEIHQEIQRLYDNYEEMERENSSNQSLGEEVLSENELYYLLSSSKYKKLIINGFIDKLQVYKKDDTYTAVIIDYKTNRITSKEVLEEHVKPYREQLYIYGKAIKELLHINGNKMDSIQLKIYFLDSKDVVAMDYEDEAANELMISIEECFDKLSRGSSIADYPMIHTEECIQCNYQVVCNAAF